MIQRSLILTLLKLIPLYILFMLAWQVTPLSRYYGHVVSALTAIAYSICAGEGPVKGVVTRGDYFFVKLLIQGRRLGLDIVAGDITSNVAMLLALYGASPMMKTARRFALCLPVSLVIMIALHVATLAATIQYALMTQPEIMRLFPPGKLAVRLVPLYKGFYEVIGMYLFVLLLWIPYIAGVLPQRELGRSFKKTPNGRRK